MSASGTKRTFSRSCCDVWFRLESGHGLISAQDVRWRRQGLANGASPVIYFDGSFRRDSRVGAGRSISGSLRSEIARSSMETMMNRRTNSGATTSADLLTGEDPNQLL